MALLEVLLPQPQTADNVEILQINEVGWNLRGDRFYLTTGSGSIKLMDDEQTEAAMSVVGHTASAYCLDVDPTGRYIATGGSDALTAIWDERTFSCVRTIDSDK
ncbi:MAG: hypothetical protein BJ554DRAFT_6395 [Olpidium bornovanus]|uniref:Uncharacterized protein n=1 Tax=Olpidium bornovanus TaxID=278681 RepID=A0A8H8A2K8_9FUNG|nr:MAG: hypothetical protein BJ554DRAFT_6395 [Olpidium bornovanus]